MARHIVDAPDHRGIANALAHLRELIANEAAFSDVRVHHSREFAEAIQLVRFDDPDEGFAEIARRRTHARPKLPPKAISTIHKAKRSEEHTSELQSPMRISYAAFCLKKKKAQTKPNNISKSTIIYKYLAQYDTIQFLHNNCK